MKSLDIDPFSSVNLADPEPFQRALHEAGAVAWLTRYKIYVTGRFDIAQCILNDPSSFISGEGVGLGDERAMQGLPDGQADNISTSHRKRTPLVEEDGQAHLENRAAVDVVLNASTIKAITAESNRIAQRLLEPLLDKGRFDAIGEWVIPVVLQAFPDAYGVVPEGRDNLLALGELALNSLGPRNANFKASAARFPQLRPWLQHALPVDEMDGGKIGRRIHDEAVRGGKSAADAQSLIQAVLISGIDTTVAGISNTLHCLAERPDQWRRVVQRPELAIRAFEEAMRVEPPVQMCYRRLAVDCELGGLLLHGGARIMIHLGAASRDPRHFPEPGRFDVQSSSRDTLSFGTGLHRCLGRALARGQAEGMIKALASRAEEIRCETPVAFLPNNTLRRPAELLMHVSQAREKRP
ncbi:cytochrome P450 [Comamonadaceae bacterium PP-2]